MDRRELALIGMLNDEIGLETVSHLQPTLDTGVDGGESDFLEGIKQYMLF